MTKNLIIAIDGPAASGKSSVSRKVAELANLIYVDSGSLYRGITWFALKQNIDTRDQMALEDMIEQIKIHFFVRSRGVVFTINGTELGSELRSDEVTKNVSFVAGMPAVRKWVTDRLREMSKLGPIIMEGRDIGTSVFPNADFKFYLNADPEERARRRGLDEEPGSDKSKIKILIMARDTMDSTRKNAPLKIADDAEVLDTTGMSLEEVIQIIYKKIL